MTQDQLLALSTIGGAILALVVAAFLLFFQQAGTQELARRVVGLRQVTAVARPQSLRLGSVFIYLVQRLGNVMRARMLSAKDADALAKTLAAAGLEPSKAMPIFIGAKLASLFGVPALVWLSTILLGYPTGKQALYAGLSVVVALMLPNWVIALMRRPYQQALRRGIPDALDLLVVCAEAGLGLESAVARVAQEMLGTNRPVGVEFSLLTHEMRIMPDRRIALTNMAERSGQPAFKRLAATITQTLKYGTPLSQGLRTLSTEMRNERMIQFEERAGKLPALLVLPMILFIMPSLFIILMGQPAHNLMSTLGTMSH